MDAKVRKPKHHKIAFEASLDFSGSLGKTGKRGDQSINYLIAIYVTLATILSAVIAVLDLRVIFKVGLILIVAAALYMVIFFSSRARNYLIGVINKIQNFREKW